ncbi:MAG: hypothetical protein IKV41_00950 [Oscillospiraceae bacterium]|nr:hypothetical protein [Oscillospiraceae bacterium]
MQIEKKVITNLTKCYSLAELDYCGQKAYLVASEKQFPCLVISRDGQILDKVWDEPGGVMTMEPLPNGSFLATHRFYSPNDAKEATIVLAEQDKEGWKVRTLCKLPFVHRFGILNRDGQTYIVAATLKSDHQFKDDWTCPGRIWVGKLPENLNTVDEEHPLELTPLVSGLLRNHGFFKYEENGCDVCLIGTENGIWKVTPPTSDGQWQAECIFDQPASDMLLADFDGDGQKELLVLAPFHGENLSVYKNHNGNWEKVFDTPQPLEFLHALATAKLAGKEVAVIGHRKGARELCLISCDEKGYKLNVLDHDIGPANVLCREDGENLWILSANRETDEVAMYTVKA